MIVTFILTTQKIAIMKCFKGNYFDFVTQDGHGLKTYFTYTILNFPKIIHRIIPFIFFITLFYLITNYEQKNELSIFWINGVSKLDFTHKILFLSGFPTE